MAVGRFRDHWHHVDILDSLWKEMHSVRANSPLRQSAQKLRLGMSWILPCGPNIPGVKLDRPTVLLSQTRVRKSYRSTMSDQTWHQKYRSKGAAATGGLGSRINGPVGRPNELHIPWFNGIKEV
jgi:hypothetical protein